jgi:hypothetical protein
VTSPPPIFLGGMFKSGTSLLRAMLGQHRNIAAGLETYWFEINPAAGTGRGGEPFTDTAARMATYFGLPAADVMAFAEASSSAEVFLDRLMSAVAAAQGKARWAEKTPGNVAHAGRIVAHWSEATVVHIVRDPRDVFASVREAGKWTSVEEFGSRWCAVFAGLVSSRAAGVLHEGNYLEIRYEDLVAEPEATMRAVVAFVGEDWDSAAGCFEGRDDEFRTVLAATGKESTTLERMKQPLNRTRLGIWPKFVPEQDIAAMRQYAEANFGLGVEWDRVIAESSATEEMTA